MQHLEYEDVKTQQDITGLDKLIKQDVQGPSKELRKNISINYYLFTAYLVLIFYTG